MANKKITELSNLAFPANGDQIPIVDIDADETKAITAANLISGANTEITAVEARRVANVAGAISSVTTSDLTASRALVSGSGGKIEVSAVTSTEIGHLDGVTSGIQTQLDSKVAATVTAANDFVTFTRLDANIDVVSANAAAVETRRAANIAGAVSTITTGNLGADKALVSDGSGKVAVSGVTATELGRLTGVTSAIQTQFTGAETRRTSNIAGAISTVLTSDLTASRALVSNAAGKIVVSAVTDTEIGHLDGVTSAIQTQLNAAETRRTANIAGAVSTITTGDLTASRAVVSDGSGKVAVSAVTATEIGHLDGVTSAIQSQIDTKAALAGATFTGQVNMSDDLVITGNLTVNGDTTTVSSTSLNVEDRMIMLADGVTGGPSADVGILFNRGNQGNAAFFYDESASTFKLSDTKDPKSNTSLSPVSASNLDVGILNATTITASGVVTGGSLTVGSTAFSESELGVLDSVTGGTVTASKAIVVDANKDIASFRNITLTGELDAGSLDVSGDADIDGTLEADAITIAGTAIGSIFSTVANAAAIEAARVANAVSLASGIAGTGVQLFATLDTDYGLLDSANLTLDAFNVEVSDITKFDMSTDPSGSLSTFDAGVFS